MKLFILLIGITFSQATIDVEKYSPQPTYEDLLMSSVGHSFSSEKATSRHSSSHFSSNTSSSSSFLSSQSHSESLFGEGGKDDFQSQQQQLSRNHLGNVEEKMKSPRVVDVDEHQGASSAWSSRDEWSVESVNPCLSKSTCSACLQTAGCAWCKMKDYFSSDGSTPLPRCNKESNFIKYWSTKSACPEREIVNPSNKIEVKQDSALKRSSKYDDAVQIRPQHVKLKLRINEPYELELYYAQAQDYPLDLYYLMDLSKSMEDDKEKLSALGDLLASTMQNITSNFRLGFGSFVDKVVMPFVSTMPKKLKEPCDGCAAPYGYKHHMKLSTDTSAFSIEVKKAQVSGNLDAPEGSFDALMQAVVCKRSIGWRDRSRKLIVLSSDAGFHFAGDGRLGGIVEPNDGVCHLDQNGLYTHSTILDYPSVAHINHKVKENSVNVIFAVTEEQFDVYNQLKDYVEGSSVGLLSADSSNVVQLIKAQYQAITSSIEVKDNAIGEYVKVSYYSNCMTSGGPLRQTNRCSGLRVGSIVQFTAKIEVVRCPKDARDWKQRFQIYPVGINESLVVDLEILCQCDCEKHGHPGFLKSSEHCSGKGDYMCGICKCSADHFGRNCECDASTLIDHLITDKGESRQRQKTRIDLEKGCRPDGLNSSSSSSVLCNNRGDCICGKCECFPRNNPDEVVYGDYCECDNFSCDRFDGLLCSGPDHGTCDCGKCVCNSEWNTPGYSACECRSSSDTCITPYGRYIGKTCSGHGDCVCGQCKCHETKNGQYSGKYCQQCPTCPGKCSELESCVDCLAFSSGELMEITDEEMERQFPERNLDFSYIHQHPHNLYSEPHVLRSDMESETIGEDGDSERSSVLAETARRRRRCMEVCDFHPVVVERPVIDDLIKSASSMSSSPSNDQLRLCSFLDEEDCRATFVYGYHNSTGKLLVWVDKDKECPVEIDIMGIILGVIGAIVAVGLMVILMWKVLTTIHDRREFARFEKEKAMAKWDAGENPIFKSATSTYKNPTYNGR